MDAVTRAVTSGEDLYALLGVAPDASDDDIRHAYRALARAHHPDANPVHGRTEAFRRIAAAYEVLGDERASGPPTIARSSSNGRRRGGPNAPGPMASHVATAPDGRRGLQGTCRVGEPSRPRSRGGAGRAASSASADRRVAPRLGARSRRGRRSPPLVAIAVVCLDGRLGRARASGAAAADDLVQDARRLVRLLAGDEPRRSLTHPAPFGRRGVSG